MATQIKCTNCGNIKLKPTHTKGCYECKECGAIIDARGQGIRFLGHVVGGALAIITLGLLPEEITDGIAGFLDDKLS